MGVSEEFSVFYNSELKHLLLPLENYRIRRIMLFKRFRNISFLMGLFLAFTIYTGNALLISLGGSLVVFALGLAYESLTKTNSYLRKEYKNRILPKMLNFVCSVFEYIPRQKISKYVFEKSLLFPREISTVEGEDFMRFFIDDVELMFCESKVYGYVPKSIMFNGIFISSTFNKTFNFKTFIFPKKTTSFFRKLKFKVLGSSFRVKLEDPEFEREFIVLSEDQVESRYILTPSLMQRILEYKRKFDSELAISFVSNRLYCSIPNSRNLFEPPIFTSFLDIDFIFKSLEPVILYTSIIKDLNLNIRIWSKL